MNWLLPYLRLWAVTVYEFATLPTASVALPSPNVTLSVVVAHLPVILFGGVLATRVAVFSQVSEVEATETPLDAILLLTIVTVLSSWQLSSLL